MEARKIRWSESSHSFSFLERKFRPGTKVPWSISSQECKFPGTKALRSECSLVGTFTTGSKSTEERKGHNSLLQTIVN